MKAQPGRSVWGTVTVAGLVMAAAGHVLVMVLDGAFAVAGLIFTLILLAVAGLVFTRNRWLMIVVVVISAFYLVSGVQAPLVQSRLANPAATGYFIVALLELLGSALAIVAGLVTLVQGFFVRPSRSVRGPQSVETHGAGGHEGGGIDGQRKAVRNQCYPIG